MHCTAHSETDATSFSEALHTVRITAKRHTVIFVVVVVAVVMCHQQQQQQQHSLRLEKVRHHTLEAAAVAKEMREKEMEEESEGRQEKK